MAEHALQPVPRRVFLGGLVAMGALALPGCATTGYGRISYVEVIERLLELASRDAFARLTAPGGFWDSEVSRLALPDLFGRRGGVVQGILTSALFKERLQHALNDYAVEGARRAAPVVADTIRTIGWANAEALVRGGPTDATSFLRQQMGPALINAMIPELAQTMRVASDPLVNQAISALAGVDVNAVAQAVANEANDAIWYQIGLEETRICEHPDQTNDALLIRTFGRH
jgi:hypothetical protein